MKEWMRLIGEIVILALYHLHRGRKRLEMLLLAGKAWALGFVDLAEAFWWLLALMWTSM